MFGSTDPSPKVKVSVNNQEVEKFDFRTGNFLTLVDVPKEENFKIKVIASNGEKRTTIERTVFYPLTWKEMELDPLAIHSNNVQPKEDQILREGNELRVMIQGSPKAQAFFRIGDSSEEISMQEMSSTSSPLETRGVYFGSYTVQVKDTPLIGETSPRAIKVILRRGNQEVTQELPGKVRFAAELPLNIIEVKDDQTRIYQVREDSHNHLGSTLGGDGLSTQVIGYNLAPGTRFEATGKAGDYFRVKLGENNYLIHQDKVKEIKEAAVKLFSGLAKYEIKENQNDVVIRFHTRERIPFLIKDDPQQLRLALFNAQEGESILQYGESSSIGRIMIEPLASEKSEVLQVTIELNQKMFGFDYFWEGTKLIVRIRKTPRVQEDNPLLGKAIVIDPGHGGNKSGAIGPRNIHEKDVVLEISKFLRDMLEHKGAKVIMTRTGDMYVDLYERIESAVEQNADLFISIHANAHAVGADAVNYHGHMTLYNYSFNEKLAEIILDNLVERIGLPWTRVWQRKDLVVLRRPQVPSVLIETAFMMHPDDNWYLLQPGNQREFAEAIMNGIINYFLSL